MPNKSPKKKYGEFRIFTEWMRRGKWRIRREFVPSLVAWLLMIGRRLEKQRDSLADEQMLSIVPGMREARDTLNVCVANIQRLMDLVTENFAHEDWHNAVCEICAMLNIKPDTRPIEEVPEGQFQHLISEPLDGSDTPGNADSLRACAGLDQGGGIHADGSAASELGGGDTNSVGAQSGHRRNRSRGRAKRK